MDYNKEEKYSNIALLILIVSTFLFGVALIHNGILNKNDKTLTKETKLNEHNRKTIEFGAKIKDIKIEFPFVKNIEQSNNIISDLTSNNVNIRKSVFNEMIRAYQNAFCIGDERNVKLPADLFEKLAANLPSDGASTISIKEFINLSYNNANPIQKVALEEILEGMNEISEDIRRWDISKAVLVYGLLKSAGIAITRENLKKALDCINGKWNYTQIERDFYMTFGLNPKNVHEILTYVTGENDWMSVEFEKKFLNLN